MADPKALIKEIKEMQAVLRVKQDMLHALQTRCNHKFSDPKYTPIVREGYQDPGDPPGTMGVDHRFPTWVPRDEKPLWTRTCFECGKVEETSRTRDDVRKVPVF